MKTSAIGSSVTVPTRSGARTRALRSLKVPHIPRFSTSSAAKKPASTKKSGIRKLWMKWKTRSKTYEACRSSGRPTACGGGAAR